MARATNKLLENLGSLAVEVRSESGARGRRVGLAALPGFVHIKAVFLQLNKEPTCLRVFTSQSKQTTNSPTTPQMAAQTHSNTVKTLNWSDGRVKFSLTDPVSCFYHEVITHTLTQLLHTCFHFTPESVCYRGKINNDRAFKSTNTLFLI